MMDQMIKDVEMDFQEAKREEAGEQKDYEEAIKNVTAKRVVDPKLIVAKESSKADTMIGLQVARELQNT